MDGKRYLYSAPVVDVKIAAPPRASRDGDKQQKEHTLLSRRAGRVNPRYPPADLVPTQPQKKIQLSKFPAVASVVSSGGVLCVPGSDGAVAGVHEGPRPISAGHTRSSRLDGGLPRAWLQRGLAKSRGVEGAGAGETCSNRRSGLPRCRWGARAGAWTPDEGVCSMLMAWRGWRRRWRLGWAWAWRSCYVGTCRLRLFVCAVGPLGQACHLRTECFPMPGLVPRTGREH